MRIITVPVVLITFALAGCAGDAPTLTSLVAHGGAASRVFAQLPFTGQCEVTFTVLPSAPPIGRQIDAGTCELSRLGASTTTGAQTINFALATQVSERTFTAANGDILNATGVGTSRPGSAPGTIDFDATLIIVGGTGRFANATGTVHDWGTANMLTHAVSFTLDGWITYDASDLAAH